MENHPLKQSTHISIASRVASISFANKLEGNTKKALFIQPKDFEYISIDNNYFLEELKAPSTTTLLEEGDILFSLKGSFRSIYINNIIAQRKVIASSSCALIKTNSTKLNAKYLVNILNSDHFQAQIKQISIGATIPSISIGTLGDIQIPLPSLETQKEIAQTLDDYKELINLRTQQLELTKQQHKAIQQKLIAF